MTYSTEHMDQYWEISKALENRAYAWLHRGRKLSSTSTERESTLMDIIHFAINGDNAREKEVVTNISYDLREIEQVIFRGDFERARKLLYERGDGMEWRINQAFKHVFLAVSQERRRQLEKHREEVVVQLQNSEMQAATKPDSMLEMANAIIKQKNYGNDERYNYWAVQFPLVRAFVYKHTGFDYPESRVRNVVDTINNPLTNKLIQGTATWADLAFILKEMQRTMIKDIQIVEKAGQTFDYSAPVDIHATILRAAESRIDQALKADGVRKNTKKELERVELVKVPNLLASLTDSVRIYVSSIQAKVEKARRAFEERKTSGATMEYWRFGVDLGQALRKVGVDVDTRSLEAAIAATSARIPAPDAKFIPDREDAQVINTPIETLAQKLLGEAAQRYVDGAIKYFEFDRRPMAMKRVIEIIQQEIPCS